MKARILKSNTKNIHKKETYGITQRIESEKLYMQNKNTGLIICFTNGNPLIDKPLSVTSPNGETKQFTHLMTYCSTEDNIYDQINNYIEYNVYEYVDMLKKSNPKLRIDLTKTAGHIYSGKMANLFNTLS